jgi:hypothetical protein
LNFLDDLKESNNFSWLKEKKRSELAPILFSKAYEEARAIKLDTLGQVIIPGIDWDRKLSGFSFIF